MARRIKRARIYRDLKVSKFRYTTLSKSFVFSSLFYFLKFYENLEENRLKLKNYFKSRFNIDFECDDYFDIILYSSIEKRGFLIIDLKTGGEIECLNQVKLNGGIKIHGKLQD